MLQFGIIGKPLAQSFSAKYFTEKFLRDGIDAEYKMYPIEDIKDFPLLCKENNFTGLNVTIPYKQSVMQYLDEMDETAKGVGAVNVIKFHEGKLIGYNTDTCGFRESIRPMLQPIHNQALVLGTGGAAKAVVYALKSMGIKVKMVSRSGDYDYTYSDLTEDIIRDNLLIINCTPLGMYPQTDACPRIPYDGITERHLIYDVIYNPETTLFLQKGKERNAQICNGLGMLYGQAEEAWKIWEAPLNLPLEGRLKT